MSGIKNAPFMVRENTDNPSKPISIVVAWAAEGLQPDTPLATAERLLAAEEQWILTEALVSAHDICDSPNTDHPHLHAVLERHNFRLIR